MACPNGKIAIAGFMFQDPSNFPADAIYTVESFNHGVQLSGPGSPDGEWDIVVQNPGATPQSFKIQVTCANPST